MKTQKDRHFLCFPERILYITVPEDAFSSFASGTLDLMQITLETGAVTRITEDATDDWDPAYTPDGNHILWSSNREGHYEIWMANADGSDPRRITNDGLDAENPTMTPDGRWIVAVFEAKQKIKLCPSGKTSYSCLLGSQLRSFV